MTIITITDHADQAKARLPRHLDGATKLLVLLDIAGARYQELETELIKLLDERYLSVAVGVQLDGLGQILNLPREVGQTDTDYRQALIGETGQLALSGQIEALLDPFIRVTGAVTVTASEFYPAGMLLIAHNDADAEDPIIDQSIIDAMDKVKAGGVVLDLRYAPEDIVFTLAQDSETDVNNNGPQDIDKGFGDEVLTDGGGLARAI